MHNHLESQEKEPLSQEYFQRTLQLKKIELDKKKATCHLCTVAILCFGFMGIEFVGGLLSGSLAILTDAAHILCDFSGILISLISIRISTIKASKSASFGYHRAEVIGALGSVLLIWGLSIWLDYQAVMRIIHPHKIDSLIMLITAGIGLLLNLLMAKILHSGMTGGHHHHNCSHDHGHDHGHHHDHGELEEDSSDGEEDEEDRVKDKGKKKKDKKKKKGLAKSLYADSSGKLQFIIDKSELTQKLAASVPEPVMKFSAQVASINQSIIQDLDEEIEVTGHQHKNLLQKEESKDHHHHEGSHHDHGHCHHDHGHSDHIAVQTDEHHSHDHDHHSHDHDHKHHHDHDHGHHHHHNHGSKKKEKSKSNVNIRATFIHVIGDIIQSIGVLIAAIIIMIKKDWVIADPITTFICSILVFLTTLPILKDVLTVLMEGKPSEVNLEKLRKHLLKVKGVLKVHQLHVWSVSVGKLAMTCHVVTDQPNRSLILHRVLKVCQVKHKILHSTIQVEGVSSNQVKEHFLDCRSQIH